MTVPPQHLPSSPPRLVVSDLDGTLLRSDGTVSARTRAALAAAEEAGATVVFATGRPPRWMRPVAEQTGHRGLAVCSNGALVYDLHQEQVVQRFPLSPEIGRSVVESIRAAMPGVSFGVESGDRFGHEQTYAIDGDVASETYVGEIADLLGQPMVKLLVRHGHLPPGRTAGDGPEGGRSPGRAHPLQPGWACWRSPRRASRRPRRWPRCAPNAESSPPRWWRSGTCRTTWPCWPGPERRYAMANAHPEVLAAVERRDRVQQRGRRRERAGELYSERWYAGAGVPPAYRGRGRGRR